MSKPVKYIWPVADTDAVCLPQQLPAAGNLILNGALVQGMTLSTSSPLSSNNYAVFPGIRRTISLTSAGDLSGVNFTINGYTDASRPISVPIAGPNANTKYTNVNLGEIFHSITSISADDAVPFDVSVGTGLSGYTLWFRNDYHRIVSHLSVGVFVQGTIDYSFVTTLDDTELLGDNVVSWTAIDGITTPTIPANSDMVNATTSILGDLTIPTHSSRININSSDATGTLQIWFLNQGIN